MMCPGHQQGGPIQCRFPLSPPCRCTGKREGHDYLSSHGERTARGPANLWILQSQSERCAAVGKGPPLAEVSGLGAGVGRYLKAGSPAPSVSSRQVSDLEARGRCHLGTFVNL